MLPYYPYGDFQQSKGHYRAMTAELHMIYAYSGIHFQQAMQLDICDYMQILRDAYITQCQKSEAGREYLENCWRISQTEPDRHALRRKFGGGS